MSIKVALVCDPLEEHWPSMDLVGDMLFKHLSGTQTDLRVDQLRPAMRQISKTYPGARTPERLLHRFLNYPAWLRGHSSAFDIFHIVDHSYSQLIHALPGARTVVTCHDLDTFRCILEPEKESRSAAFRLMTKRIISGLQKATRVICVSETIRDEFLRFRIVPPERVDVVLNGVHPDCTWQPDPPSDEAIQHLLGLTPDSRYLLHVGSTIPRKRIDALLHVFAGVRHSNPEIRLIRVGGEFAPQQRELATKLGLLNHIVVLPHIKRRELSAIYRRADLLLLTSEAEGFGLPLIEAMACGCPVVASDLTVLKEIGGDAASFCPVGNIETWTATVNSLLLEKHNHPAAWQCRRERGIENAARFTWDQSAAKCADIYRSILN